MSVCALPLVTPVTPFWGEGGWGGEGSGGVFSVVPRLGVAERRGQGGVGEWWEGVYGYSVVEWRLICQTDSLITISLIRVTVETHLPN